LAGSVFLASLSELSLQAASVEPKATKAAPAPSRFKRSFLVICILVPQMGEFSALDILPQSAPQAGLLRHMFKQL
jgi:hypothetical protein